MKDKESVLKQLKQIKLPRVFRQNIIIIFIASMMISVLYYPFFLFNRGKHLVKIENIKRKYMYLITPFIGLIAVFIMSCVGIFYISHKENISLKDFSTIQKMMDIVISRKYPIYTVANQITYVFTLLCFIVPLSDLLIQFSEKMKTVKAAFPKFIANTPAVFTIIGLLYVLVEAIQIGQNFDFTWLNPVVELLFVVAIVLSHIYLVNVYVLFTAIKLPISEGENK